MNKLALIEIWQDIPNDLGYYKFADGAIYKYTTAGSANDAALVANIVLHGLYFNSFPHRKRGQTGYQKVNTTGTATLLWSYPPYAPTGTL